MLVTGGDKKIIVKISCIYYLVQFQEGREQIKALRDSNNKVNARNPDYAWKLRLKIQKTKVGA